jgi:Flp pilus assembly protein TadD
MPASRRQDLSIRRFGSAAMGLLLLAGAAGCATDRTTTGSVSKATASSGKAVETMSSEELRGAAGSLGQSYAKNPKDMGVAMRYAAVLQMSGHSDQALAVMRKLAIDFPRERSVLAAYGKALASAGQFEAALDAVRRAQTPEYPDWKLLSAEGAILDQLGQRDEARRLYRKALDLRPNEATIYSNMGMSYVLEGDLKTAEDFMRKAVAGTGGDSRVRQNLALVVGLQGRFKEAEQIAAQELSAQQAQANVAYLRSMLSQQAAWNELEKEGRKKRN